MFFWMFLTIDLHSSFGQDSWEVLLWAPRVESFTVKSKSQLARIDTSCFSNCIITSICIPRSVEFLGVSCFEYVPGEPRPASGGPPIETRIDSFTFDPGSSLGRFADLCFSDCRLESLCVPRSVEVLGKSCFSRATIDVLEFESEPGLREIDELCFEHCILKSICLPRLVEALPAHCFEHASVEIITFEKGHSLRE
jgi:hypothetical protein